jgi:hypothetical protein
MVSSLEEVYGIIRDTVHQPVFLANTTRRAACQYISKRLRLSQPLEWIPHHCLHEIRLAPGAINTYHEAMCCRIASVEERAHTLAAAVHELLRKLIA